MYFRATIMEYTMKKQVFTPRFARGWVLRQHGGETLAVLTEGALVRLVPDRSLNFGTPVDVVIHEQSQRRRGEFYGEVLTARALPTLNGEERPLALLDAANLSTENREPESWRIGAVRSWALAFGLDEAGYKPVFVADPGHLRAALRHPLSAAVYGTVRSLMARTRGWQWRCVDDGAARCDVADREILRLAEANPGAIILSRDHFASAELRTAFPWLTTASGQARIFCPTFSDGRAFVGSLGVAGSLPAPLFAAALRRV